MALLSIRVDLASLAATRSGLQAESREIKQLVYRTINETGRHVRTKLSKEIRGIAPLPKKIVDKHISLRLASPKDTTPFADIEIVDLGRLSLKLYRPKQTKKSGVSVTLDKGQGPTPVPGAFGPRVDKLRRAVFRRKGKSRLPITRLFGPGVWDVMDSRRLDEVARTSASEYLDKRLNQRLALLLSDR